MNVGLFYFFGLFGERFNIYLAQQQTAYDKHTTTKEER